MGVASWGVRLADWRKAEDYSFPPNFPRARWAWEFLRRNPEYRGQWDAALSRFLARTEEFEEHEDWAERIARGEHLVFTGEVGKMETENPADPLFYLPVNESFNWHIQVLVNPATDAPSKLGFSPGYGGFHVLREGAALISQGPSPPNRRGRSLLPNQAAVSAAVYRP